jgi:endogenous inhibitor of DNA gyrase (YacG/DUF329 family)
MPVGLVCSRCDALTGLDATRCPVCQAPVVEAAPSDQLPGRPKPAVRVEESMSTNPCPSCGNPVPIGDHFCGQCGARIEAPPAPSSSAGKTMFFSGVQASGVAKLVVVKANSADGLAYELGGTEHVVGRSEGAILFPDDPLVSPRHANFFYRDGKLFVRDEGSINGVFLRIRNPVAAGIRRGIPGGRAVPAGRSSAARFRAAARCRRNLLLRQPQAGLQDADHPAAARGRDWPHRARTR